MLKRLLVERKWLVVLEATKYTRIYGSSMANFSRQRLYFLQVGICSCSVALQGTLKWVHITIPVLRFATNFSHTFAIEEQCVCV